MSKVCSVALALFTFFPAGNNTNSMYYANKSEDENFLLPATRASIKLPLCRRLNVLIIGETESGANEMAERLDYNLEYSSAIKYEKYVDGQFYCARNKNGLQFIKFTVDVFFKKVKENRELIGKLIDNTDLIYYVCSKEVTSTEFSTLKKCYDTVNKIWCVDVCKTYYPEEGYQYGGDRDWHVEAMIKKGCGTDFHYYWMTYVEGMDGMEFFKRVLNCNEPSEVKFYTSCMPNGRSLSLLRYAPYRLGQITTMCRKEEYSKIFASSNLLDEKEKKNKPFGTSLANSRLDSSFWIAHFGDILNREKIEQILRENGYREDEIERETDKVICEYKKGFYSKSDKSDKSDKCIIY